MSSQEIAELVRKQIAAQGDRRSSHGLDLRACVLEWPVKDVFISYEGGGEVERELWRVLEEGPENQSGYMVCYDEERRVFGLALRSATNDPHVYLGAYGDFWDTMASM